ncbi:MAG TPA: phosphatidylglycerophosphatase A [Thermosynergistes sp.]|nr:phosphatidylglycerophosphatase A [Thermosynergistes sp.]HPU77064.1 phosphatidylglycerophosphatase A [Thermosynergistes sp.]HPZ75769.1 phosphatidylglycerophosphatase A [Thermosynergistes sp.]HQE21095.1 phosphatidylglycerophosphatase A [Thermosynergistes sp.]HXK89343.1 phosphatidylglycerophosphatase A [Thermosynergistes sp.]
MSSSFEKRGWYEWVVTLGGLGRIVPMPGTVASLAACLVASVVAIPIWVVGIVAALGLFTVYLYIKETQGVDPKEVVIDEIVGSWIAVWGHGLSYALPAFLLFRIFDILKPMPVSTVEKRLPGTWGIMADDVVAGCLSNVVLWLLRWAFGLGG